MVLAAPTVTESQSVPGSPTAITYSPDNAAVGASASPTPPPAPPAAAPAVRPAGGQPFGSFQLEQRLADLRYDTGPVDGDVDEGSTSAVMTFQKVNGMERTGRISPELIASVQSTTSAPPPLVPGGGANRVEIDLARQVLFLYEGDALSRILPVSTGSGERFCQGGRCRNAVTNVGSFQIYRQDRGWETSPLGRLYNAQYYDGGIAIHGSNSVPASPVSHGCVRIPMRAAEWFPSHVSVGTPVYVVG
jgi:lipoprotein-anchoring transpeptidase ErfK/SrfK